MQNIQFSKSWNDTDETDDDDDGDDDDDDDEEEEEEEEIYWFQPEGCETVDDICPHSMKRMHVL